MQPRVNLSRERTSRMIPPAQVAEKTQSEEFDLVSFRSKTSRTRRLPLPSMADLKAQDGADRT